MERNMAFFHSQKKTSPQSAKTYDMFTNIYEISYDLQKVIQQICWYHNSWRLTRPHSFIGSNKLGDHICTVYGNERKKLNTFAYFYIQNESFTKTDTEWLNWDRCVTWYGFIPLHCGNKCLC